MKCPLCQTDLLVQKQEIYTQYDELICPNKLGLKLNYNDTHYHKYVDGNWGHFDKIEEMSFYPFKITNYHIYYGESKRIKNDVVVEVTPARDVTYCSIKKYNPNRTTRGPIKEVRPGYERILQLPVHIHPDIEERLRDRLKLLLIIS
jgi:hypothetical protein